MNAATSTTNTITNLTMEDDMGYEDCAPATVGGEHRRSSLFHVADVGASKKEHQQEGANHSNKKDRKAKRRNRRRGSVTHVRATNGQQRSEEEETKPKRSPRRRSISGLFSNMDVSLASSNNNKSDDGATMEDSSASSHKDRKAHRRRSSIFHVNQVLSDRRKEEDSHRSKSRSLNLNPFARSHTTGSTPKSHSSKRKDKKRSGGSHKKKSATEEVLKELEQFQALVKAIHKNPESRKMLQQRLQQESPGEYVRAA